jgi:hypothetical protein
MQTHHFTLILAGVSDIGEELADGLCEALGGDIEFGMRDGIAMLEVTRPAPTLLKAIRAAIKDIHQANLGVRVVRVETEAANVIAKS